MVPYEKFRRGNYECPICQQKEFYVPVESGLKKTGFRILALDQATYTTGWSIFDGDKLIKYGHWNSSGRTTEERIAQTKQWMASMIKKWNPDKIVIEEIQLQTYKKSEEEVIEMVKTFKTLAQLQGTLLNYLYENNFFYKPIPVGSWKKHSQVTGKGRTDQKRSAQLRVKAIFNIDATQDESDAILIGRYAAFDNKSNEIIDFG